MSCSNNNDMLECQKKEQGNVFVKNHILVVDDDSTVTELLHSVLEKKQYQVAVKNNGLDALVYIKKEDPDLVILDIMMPEINGYDVCYELRFNPDFEKIPIILLTARDNELGDKLGRMTNIKFIKKPIDTERILQSIEMMLTS